MRLFKLVSTLLMAVILASCGGGNSDVPAKPKFTSQVSFGDSLSDVGSYKVGTIAAAGGGQFTVNGAAGAPTNWTEFMALDLGLPAPRAAVTGGFGVARSPATGSTAGYYAYGQGGARVDLQPGVGNTGTLAGALTEPVTTQIANHITTNGNFSGNEIVFVMAGANDILFYETANFSGLITLPNAELAVQAAAAKLVSDVNALINTNGAKYVVVVNVPDIGSTPYAASIGATRKSNIDLLVSDFNTVLKNSLPDSANVLNVNAFNASHDEVLNPGKYNLSNVTTPACNIAVLPNNSSLTCTSSTLIPAADSHYLFADMVHPTPYGHSLFALYVLQAMTNKGWY